jgi:hypothetical protein
MSTATMSVPNGQTGTAQRITEWLLLESTPARSYGGSSERFAAQEAVCMMRQTVSVLKALHFVKLLAKEDSQNIVQGLAFGNFSRCT